MLRLIDSGSDGPDGAALISHTHNQCTWTPSHGQPLTPDGYRQLFETLEPRLFAEAGLFADVVRGGPLDLTRRDDVQTLEAAPALTIAASRHPGVFARHALVPPPGRPRGEFRLNPLYVRVDAPATADDRTGNAAATRFRLQFPSDDYEQEYGACREYLPDAIAIPPSSLQALDRGEVPADLSDWLRRRVIVDLPKRYY
jgi:hypothetical protein